MNTEMGKIADLIQTDGIMETPLQHRLEQLGKILIVVATGVDRHGRCRRNYAWTAGIRHVPGRGQPGGCSDPGRLPAIVTIALALGVQRMIKRKAIVRKLPSVETWAVRR